MKTKLKPCPFCGSSEIELKVDDGLHWNRCMRCCAEGPTGSKYSDEEDVQYFDWNSRIAPATQQREADGWKLVPVDPTEKMMRAWANANVYELTRHGVDFSRREISFRANYAAMLAASPATGEQAQCERPQDFASLLGAERLITEALRTENAHLFTRVGELTEALTNARDWFESQAKALSKGCGSPFELMQVRDERDACDAALAQSQRGDNQ